MELLKYPNSKSKSTSSGQSTSDLTIYSSLFSDNSETAIWKFELLIETISPHNGLATGTSSIITIVNQLPKAGSCSISPTNGTVANTVFTISCINWLDIDGEITKYSYYGKI
jgi:hypothetical protein